MTDILQRLENLAEVKRHFENTIYADAAAEIKRLRADVWNRRLSMAEIECEYWLPDRGQTRADAFIVMVKNAWDADDVVTEAADDYHGNHDGWEVRWPLKIAVWFEGAEHVFEVEREYAPYFSASPT